jgi:hypothetical protein
VGVGGWEAETTVCECLDRDLHPRVGGSPVAYGCEAIMRYMKMASHESNDRESCFQLGDTIGRLVVRRVSLEQLKVSL